MVSVEFNDAQALEDELMGPDQRALGQQKVCRRGGGVRLLDRKFFVFPDTKKMRDGHKREFIHFTNNGRFRSLNNRNMSRYFTNVLGLPADLKPFSHASC